MSLREAHTPEIRPGVFRVTVTSEKKPEYAEPVADWIQSELVQKTRAVEASLENPPTPIREGPLYEPTARTESRDIPDQIRKLAELRDTGVISVEEFEAKKKDLLDRM